MKKTLLTTAALSLLSAGIMAQGSIGQPVKKKLHTTTKSVVQRDYSKPNLEAGQLLNRGCASATPTKEWDKWFNQKVEERKQDMANGRVAATTYTIPIVFHIIYTSTNTVGNGDNISQAQVNSQIPVLNADYAGIGYNSCQYANMSLNGHGPFYDYAVANTLPSPDNNGTIIGNSGITFCLATKNASGTTLTEPGIDRVSWESISGATNPATATQTQLTTLFDGTIKPATIWDPTRYFNVWTSASTNSGLLGYSTFPTGTTLSGLSGGGSGTASSTTDGCWVCCTSLGSTGSVSSPYQYGRTLTHESGHYFGLRHIWGDNTSTTTCVATDYCNDTPPAFEANYVAWPTAYPYVDPAAPTGTNACADDGDGEMFMNFMDYSDDAAMWMFTTDQITRMHTALSQCSDRSGLTASSATLCSGSTGSAPVAAFTPPSPVCAGEATLFTDASTGVPSTWAWTVSPGSSVTVTPTTNNCANAYITFPSAGTYTVTDAVANGTGSNSVSHVVTVTVCAVSTTCDTASHIGNTDSLSLYNTTTGYFTGNNNYAFKGLAEAYATTDFQAGTLQVQGAIICFFRESTTIGTHGVATHTATTLSMVNSSTNPGGTAVASKAITFANIAATPGVTNIDYAGTPGLGYQDPIIVPYVVTFATPVPLTSAFFLSLTVGATTGDTIALFSGAQNHNANNTAWVKYNNAWGTFAADAGENLALAIFPIACPVNTTGGIETNHLGNSINLFPNPNNGQFTFAVSLTEATNLNFTIINTLGQVVYAKTENNVTNAVLSCDLSNLAKGIYYANITDSNNNRTIKKIIIE